MKRWPDMSFVKDTPGLNREGAEFLAKAGEALVASNQTGSPG